MNHWIVSSSLSTVLFCLVAVVPAATLKVGPHQQFAKPSQAIQAAKEGDHIEIEAGEYAGDVATIRANHLTIRGVGNGRAKLSARGKDADGKAIWVVVGSDSRMIAYGMEGVKYEQNALCVVNNTILSGI
jgi:hypothetical protein